MFVIPAIWLCFALMLQGDILVLKNGKNLPCDEYAVGDGRVTIVAKGQTFSIPENLVDWEASQKAKTALDQKQKAEAAKKAQKSKKKPPKQRGQITLTTKDLKSKERTAIAGPVTVKFRMAGNSIIVGMTFNDKGPYDFVLDTGASITAIDPDILEEAGIKPGKDVVEVVGVGGRPIKASVCKIPKLSLEGATVYNMNATAYRIAPLFNAGFYGLIGQDFLNHFVMNLDTSTKTLTLTPTGTTPSETTIQDSGQKFDPHETTRKLESAFRTIESHAQKLGQTRTSSQTNRIIRELRQADRELRDVKQQLRYQKSALRAGMTAKVSEQERTDMDKLSACLLKADLFIDQISIFNRTLTRAIGLQKPGNNLMEDLKRQMHKSENTWQSWDACHKGLY